MKDLRQKVAYLHGLAEGLEIDDGSKEGKVLTQIIDVLGEIAEAVTNVQNAHEELEEYVEDIDEDLSLEEDYYCDEEDEEMTFVQVECPNCGETVFFEKELAEDDTVELTCPSCGETIGDEERLTYDDEMGFKEEKEKETKEPQ